jgi:cation:H+ antiporter
MIIDLLFFFTGLFLLYTGADFLVKGASRLAVMARIEPLIVGVTVVAFGTSSPEFIVSFVAALSGHIDVAGGNIVGSNIANIALILGVSSMIRPLMMESTNVSRESYWMVAVGLIFWIFSVNGIISHTEGWILFSGIILFTLLLVRQSVRDRKTKDFTTPVDVTRLKNLPVWAKAIIYLIYVVGGIAVLVWGSDITINAATNIARTLGVSEILIGLSLVAFGTSLPELATAIISLIRGEKAILIGNVIGSNIFNVLFVGGAISGVFTLPVAPRMIRIDIPLMLLISLIILPMILRTRRISRIAGILLLAYYAIYLIFIYMKP